MSPQHVILACGTENWYVHLVEYFAGAFRRFIRLHPINRDDSELRKKKGVVHVCQLLADLNRPTKEETDH